MITEDKVLDRLAIGTDGTDWDFYSTKELDRFAELYCDQWDENTSEDVVAEALVDYFWGTDKECRRCTNCGHLFREGYMLEGGKAYYCSDECLHSDFTDEEWEMQCEHDDQSCYIDLY